MSPEEVTPPKKMLEFSRKFQEDKIVEDMKDDINQLTKEECDLEVFTRIEYPYIECKPWGRE